MRLRTTRLAAALLAALVAVPLQAQEAPSLSREQMAEFLRTAEVVRARDLDKGITRPVRLTLSDGRLTHDAVFQSVDEARQVERFEGGRLEINFRDSWQYNVAAYRLGDLLGLGHMIPVTVERRYRNRRGSLAWWITWKWDEQMRLKANLLPPDSIDWSKQQAAMRVFGELVYDTDRNQTNILITEDWKLWMIDFSRAFRTLPFLRRPELVQRCSQDLYDRLRALTADSIKAATAPHLGKAEIEGVLKRRDKIVERLDTLARERGRELVFF